MRRAICCGCERQTLQPENTAAAGGKLAGGIEATSICCGRTRATSGGADRSVHCAASVASKITSAARGTRRSACNATDCSAGSSKQSTSRAAGTRSHGTGICIRHRTIVIHRGCERNGWRSDRLDIEMSGHLFAVLCGDAIEDYAERGFGVSLRAGLSLGHMSVQAGAFFEDNAAILFYVLGGARFNGIARLALFGVERMIKSGVNRLAILKLECVLASACG